MMVIKWLVFLFAFAAAADVPANACFEGRVFSDRNGNGIFDSRDRSLPGVMVSDGLNVTETDADGRFSLPGHDKARFVFVTTPSGYMTDNAHYRKITPEAGTYDFALTPYNPGIRKDGSHVFIQTTDTEISGITDENRRWAENIRQYAENSGAAFIIHTGDICYEKGLKSHIGLMNAGNMGIPVYYCIGNHDLVKGRYGEELFESIYGPAWYSFDVAGTHYMVLPMLTGDYRPSYTLADVAAWMENDLAHIGPGTPVVAFCHGPMTSGYSFLYKGADGQVADLTGHNLKAWIYGHIHTNYIRMQGDVPTICTSASDKAGIDHSMGGFRSFTVGSDGSVSPELRFPYIDGTSRIASPSGRTASKRLTVNAYSTVSDVKSVTASCYCDGRTVFRNLRPVQMTGWTWSADMPIDGKYAGKELKIETVTVFEDGRQMRDTSDFTYSPDGNAVSLSGDWTNLLGNSTHTAKAAHMGDNPELAWVTNVGADILMTSPLVYDGKIYTATTDEDMKGLSFICSLDGRDGKILWKYQTRGSVKNTIVIEKGLVFAQDIYGWLYAVDAVTGKLSWEQRLPVNDGLPPLIDGLASRNGVVYAGSGSGLSAYDAVSGRRLWKNEDWKQREGTTSTLAVSDKVVVAGVQWMALYGNDAATGRMLWKHDDLGLRNRGASPAIYGDRIYVISENSFFIIDALSGDVIVNKRLPYLVDATSTPLLTRTSIIFGTANAGVAAIDRKTFQPKWSFSTGNALIATVPYTRPMVRTVETSPVLSGDTVYIGASDGCIYGLDADTGKEKWRYSTGAPIFGTVAVSGNTLIASDFGGNIYAFAASDNPADRPWISSVKGSNGTWQGFRMTEYPLGQFTVQIAEPEKFLPGRPWVLSISEIGGYHWQMHEKLLENGVGVVAADIYDLYGSDSGLDLMDSLYVMATEQFGFADKCALYGVSRAGLSVYRWAMRHPQRVGCIYCEGPVLDFRTWPMRWEPSFRNWEELKKCYGFASDDEAMAYRGNPIDNLGLIAEAGIPALHVISLTDEHDTKTVPNDENTLKARDILKKMGYGLEVRIVPEGMSVPYEFDDESVRFIISNLSDSVNRADDIRYANTIKIEPDDTRDRIIAKAAHVIPTENQMAALENEFIAFIHFGPNTFTGMEWGTGKEDPKIFDLKELDTDQWCAAMKAAGMKMVIFTAKHHDGFVLWQSRYTDHGIMSTGFRNGKGDVLKDLSESCRKYGLKLGIYLSPADLYQIESPGGLYGNLSKPTLRTIPREVPGHPFADDRKFRFVVDDYNEYFLNQLYELLTEYGPIHEVWFDGAHPKRKGGQQYNYKAWQELIHTLAPEAVIFGKEDVRWCGNESGATRDTEWNVIPYGYNPDTASVFPDMTEQDLGSREKLYAGQYIHYQQAEINTSIREGWFYRDDGRQKTRSADDVFDIYERATGGNSTFLLNIPPDKSGRFQDIDVKVLEETGRRIRATYGTDLLAGADGPDGLTDGDKSTYTVLDGPGDSFEVSMATPVTINRIVLQEAIMQRGERVERHAVDAWVDGAWQEIASATNIGYKRILRFPDVTTDRLRFRLLESRLSPAISTFSAHYYKAGAPGLHIAQDDGGTVTIAPELQDFNWKNHSENAAANLSAGCRIFYTVDGSEPDGSSIEYTAPVKPGPCVIKAVAILHDEKGPVASETIGYARNEWEVIEDSGSVIVIDLGSVRTLKGFAYTPRIGSQAGTAEGSVVTCTDGKTWEKTATFNFGNLINDPSRRFCHFGTPVHGRYIRIGTGAESRMIRPEEILIF